MAIYSIGRLITGTAVGTAAYELRTASTDRGRLLRMDVLLQTSATLTFGLGRPGAIGVTPTSPVAWRAHDPGDPAGTVQSALAWATGPTAPTNFFIRIDIPQSSNRLQYSFPDPLVIAVSSSIVIWNITATAACHFMMLGEE